MPAVGGMPTLSRVRGWATHHLTEAATRWTRVATVWEDAFTELATQINNPGGTLWEGVAAEAAQQRAYSDRLHVVRLADQLHDASQIALNGATQIDEARRLVLRSVTAAENAGFTVGEDFSVTDPRLYDAGTAAVRQAQAEAFATELRTAAATLVATDSGVAGQLTAATAGLGSAVFPESGDASIQLVDYKKSPSKPAPSPSDVASTVDDMLDGQDLGAAEREQLRQILTQKLNAAAAQGLSPDQAYADAENAATTYMANLHRSYVRKASRLDAWREAKRAPNGDLLSRNTADLIPARRNTNGELIWVDKDTGKEVGIGPQGPPNSMTVPEKGQAHLGHKYGEENWRVLKQAEEEGWTQEELNDFMNQRGRYRVETPAENHGHAYEDKSPYTPHPEWTPDRIKGEHAAPGAGSSQEPAGGGPTSAPMGSPIIGPIVTIPPDVMKAAGGAIGLLGGIAAFLVHPFSPVD